MDDKFLHDLRRAPTPEFARRLRTSLHGAEIVDEHRFGGPFTKWAAMVASVALVSIAFTFPAVRAGAQAFLDLFRVASVRAVAFDAENLGRLEQLDLSGLDLPKIVGENIEVLAESGPPTSYATLEDAAAAAGHRVLTPAWTPPGWELTTIEVAGENAVRLTVDTAPLQAILDGLGIDDVSIPAGLDGQQATIRVPPVVHLEYTHAAIGGHAATEGQSATRLQLQLLQARSPEVSFPAGLDLAALAEIGLRILGLERDEAYRFAQSIDWRSTLIVPVPAADASFTEVNVGGSEGLLIQPQDEYGGLLLWASGTQVFALGGPLSSPELLEVAQTLQ
jgi:hypothetical protein